MNELMSIGDVYTMAGSIAKAGYLMGCKNQDEAFALMMLAQAEGRHPAIVQRDYHIINGRPTLKADAILARFQDAGGTVEYKCLTDERCEMIFSHKSGGSVSIDWDLKRAQQAGVTGNPTWKKYPRAMLRARCISEGVRTVFPSVLCGTYTPEEVQDFAYEGKPAEPVREVPCEIVEPVSRKILDVNTPAFEAALSGLLSGTYTLDFILQSRDTTPQAAEALTQAMFDKAKGVDCD